MRHHACRERLVHASGLPHEAARPGRIHLDPVERRVCHLEQPLRRRISRRMKGHLEPDRRMGNPEIRARTVCRQAREAGLHVGPLDFVKSQFAVRILQEAERAGQGIAGCRPHADCSGGRGSRQQQQEREQNKAGNSKLHQPALIDQGESHNWPDYSS
jgi:hypothetical protein